MGAPATPRLAVDLIIRVDDGIVLVRRAHEPVGWALPGGFVEVGETLEEAALREAREETGLEVTLRRQVHAYSDPERDPRGHVVSVVFEAHATGEPRGGSDAGEARVWPTERLGEAAPVFDHPEILHDYLTGRY